MKHTTEETHRNVVRYLSKPGADILRDMTPNQAHLLHMAVGVAGESGELLDAIKKAVIYQRPLDIRNVIEELGDIEFFLQGLRMALAIDRADVLAANIEKLQKRYATGGYSNAQAIARADKED